MISYKYNIATNDGAYQSITTFVEGHDPLVATAEHPNFKGIYAKLGGMNGRADSYEALQELFAMEKLVLRKLGDQGLSERVAITKGVLTLDRDPIKGVIAEHILQLVTADQNVAPVVRFLEKVATNLQQQSRDNLYQWLSSAGLTLCEDGDFIGYKGVQKLHDADTTPTGAAKYLSSSSGHAYVNGIEHRGQIPTGPNTVVEMPRSEVTFDPGVSCSAGLHVGTFSYAGGFGSVRLVVKVNPRDVVSVPLWEHEKMRVCRYMVLQEVSEPLKSFDPTTLVAKIKVEIGTSEARDTIMAEAAAREAAMAEATAAPEKPKRVRKVSTAKRVAKAVAKAAGKKPTKPKPVKIKKVKAGYEADEKLPEFYEDFRRPHFERLSLADLKWLAAQWEVVLPARAPKQVLMGALNKEAAHRRRTLKSQAST